MLLYEGIPLERVYARDISAQVSSALGGFGRWPDQEYLGANS